VKQHRQAMRVRVAADVAAALMKGNPARDDLVGGTRTRIVEELSGGRKSAANRGHEPMECQDLR